MANNKTIFQRLNGVLRGNSGNEEALKRFGYHSSANRDEVLFKTSNKDEYEKKLATMSQEKLLSMQWIKAGMCIFCDAETGRFTPALQMMWQPDWKPTAPVRAQNIPEAVALSNWHILNIARIKAQHFSVNTPLNS